jgi:hypothetical protein
MNIVIDAVVNDTVGTLMAGAMEDPKCAIGVILCKFPKTLVLKSSKFEQ